MSSPDTKKDRHYVLRGSFIVPPDKFYTLVISNIRRAGFLKIVASNESERMLKIVSDRKEDPRGVITFTVTEWMPNKSHFKMHVEDEEYLADVWTNGLEARYGKGCKMAHTLGGILISEPPGAKDRENIANALVSYAGLIASAPQMRQGLYGIAMPGGKEMMEMVEFVEKYADTYTAERANKIASEIKELRYEVDAPERMAQLVKAEKNMVTVSLAAYKKSLQWNLATYRQLPSNRMLSHVQFTEDNLRIVDRTANEYNLDLSLLP